MSTNPLNYPNTAPPPYQAAMTVKNPSQYQSYGTMEPITQKKTQACWENCCWCCYCCCQTANAAASGLAEYDAITDLSAGNNAANTYMDVAALSGSNTAESYLLIRDSAKNGEVLKNCCSCICGADGCCSNTAQSVSSFILNEGGKLLECAGNLVCCLLKMFG